VGTVTLIYDHHASGITEKLADAQHEHHELVVSTSHAHLVHDSCLEVLIAPVKSPRVQIADRLSAAARSMFQKPKRREILIPDLPPPRGSCCAGLEGVFE
jgi:metal-responsive CopG/Arc/MetJ family transcriptional regulator